MSNSEQSPLRRPGPRRESGAPAGPDEVRRAVLDAAADLFVKVGLHRVSLRDIAAAADVHPALIGRYIGKREELVTAVFDDLTTQLAAAVMDNPLEGQGHGPDTVMGRWVLVANQLVIDGRPIAGRNEFNPVMAMASTLMEGYGLDDLASRVRAAQIVATALGWRIFEEYLVASAHLDDVPIETLREELVHSARRLGATGWPSPPDPVPRHS